MKIFLWSALVLLWSCAVFTAGWIFGAGAARREPRQKGWTEPK